MGQYDELAKVNAIQGFSAQPYPGSSQVSCDTPKCPSHAEAIELLNARVAMLESRLSDLVNAYEHLLKVLISQVGIKI